MVTALGHIETAIYMLYFFAIKEEQWTRDCQKAAEENQQPSAALAFLPRLLPFILYPADITDKFPPEYSV